MRMMTRASTARSARVAPPGVPAWIALASALESWEAAMPARTPGRAERGREQVDDALDVVPPGEGCQLTAGELAGEVGDQQRPLGQDGSAVHGQQRLPAAQGAAVDVGAPRGRAGAAPLRDPAEAGELGLLVLAGPLPPAPSPPPRGRGPGRRTGPGPAAPGTTPATPPRRRPARRAAMPAPPGCARWVASRASAPSPYSTTASGRSGRATHRSENRQARSARSRRAATCPAVACGSGSGSA